MRCDMCGKEGNLCKAIVEGAEMEVCNDCAKLGRRVTQEYNEKERKVFSKPSVNRVKRLYEERVNKSIVEGYGHLIKNKREKLNLKQEELAKKIAEKVSVIHNIESEHLEPSIKIAKKLEMCLHIKLIEMVSEQKYEKTINIMDRGLTLGDMIKIKR